MSENRGFFEPTLAPPRPRIDVVLDEIRGAILTRRLSPGQALVESELARVLGVSKTPVREALKILALSGLVTFVPYKGASVRSVDEEFIRSVYEIRLLLEPAAVGMAVQSGQGFDDTAAILADAHTAAKAGDRARLSLLNRQFHGSLYAHCGNPILIDVLENMRDRAALIGVASWEISPTWEAEWEEHQTVLLAAQAGDAEGTTTLLRSHIQGFLDRTLTALGEQ